MSDILDVPQNFSTTLNVPGGIDNSQTTGIILTSVSGLPTDGGILCLDWANPLDTDNAEYIEYGGISGNTLTGVSRGQEGLAAKAHSNGAVIAGVLSRAHIKRLKDNFTAEHDRDTGAHTDITGTSVTVTGDIETSAGAVITDTVSEKTAGAGTAFANGISWDGWTPGGETWTYASASSFTIAGVDRTSRYTKGTKLKLTQTTAKYFVVASSSFSTNTTVNVIPSSDYTVANAAITNPFYSYIENPQAWPGWFNYAVTWTGYSANPTTQAKWSTRGNTLYFVIHCTAAGTSNATTNYASVPVVPLAGGMGGIGGACREARDNSAILSGAAKWSLLANDTNLYFNTNMTTGAWTNSGTKHVGVEGFYQF